MAEPIIVNYIDISGEDILLEDISKEKMQEISKLFQERIMTPAGYRRKKVHCPG